MKTPALGSLILPLLLVAGSAGAQPGPLPFRERATAALDRRARLLDDSLALSDAQEAGLRGLFANVLDTLQAPRRTERPDGPDGRGTPGMRPGMNRDGFGGPGRRTRSARPPVDDAANPLFERLFAGLDADVRALLTPEQAPAYDAFRAREQARAAAEATRRAQTRAERRRSRG